jgi:hypothetical protein
MSGARHSGPRLPRTGVAPCVSTWRQGRGLGVAADTAKVPHNLSASYVMRYETRAGRRAAADLSRNLTCLASVGFRDNSKGHPPIRVGTYYPACAQSQRRDSLGGVLWEHEGFCTDNESWRPLGG